MEHRLYGCSQMFTDIEIKFTHFFQQLFTLALKGAVAEGDLLPSLRREGLGLGTKTCTPNSAKQNNPVERRLHRNVYRLSWCW